MRDRLRSDADPMTLRRCTAEHPFDTIKACMSATHFLTWRLPNVRTEMALNVLAYNIKRMSAIRLGSRPSSRSATRARRTSRYRTTWASRQSRSCSTPKHKASWVKSGPEPKRSSTSAGPLQKGSQRACWIGSAPCSSVRRRYRSCRKRKSGSTIGQPGDLPCSPFGLRSPPSVAVESGEVIKIYQWVGA